MRQRPPPPSFLRTPRILAQSLRFDQQATKWSNGRALATQLLSRWHGCGIASVRAWLARLRADERVKHRPAIALATSFSLTTILPGRVLSAAGGAGPVAHGGIDWGQPLLCARAQDPPPAPPSLATSCPPDHRDHCHPGSQHSPPTLAPTHLLPPGGEPGKRRASRSLVKPSRWRERL
jgi:hypothetical protein